VLYGALEGGEKWCEVERRGCRGEASYSRRWVQGWWQWPMAGRGGGVGQCLGSGDVVGGGRSDVGELASAGWAQARERGRGRAGEGSLGACVVLLGSWGSCGLVAWSFLEREGGSRDSV
jgi:hypothetical protein